MSPPRPPSPPRAHPSSRRVTKPVALRANGSGPHLTRARSAPRILGDRYELKRRIGAGGMAEVYLATDLILERDVAVKVLHARWAKDEAQVDRFRREALALATLDTPRIINVYDMHLGPDEYYLVMRHVLGRTFEQLIEEGGPLAPERASRLVGDILEGLTALHARRLVHRDIKPANVLVDWEDRAVLVDLGVAFDRRKRSLTPAHVTLGTPDFMAPEQRTTGAVDHRSDLYQVGNLLLHALTGRDPTTMDAPARAALIASLPPRHAQVVERALAEDPEARWASAEVMRTTLASASNSLATEVVVITDDAAGEVIEPRPVMHARSRMRRLTRPQTPPPIEEPPVTQRPPTAPPVVQAPVMGLPAVCEPLPAPAPAVPRRRPWRWIAGTAAAAFLGFAVTAAIVIWSSARRADEVEPWTPRSLNSSVRAELVRRWAARRPVPAPVVLAAPAPAPAPSAAKPVAAPARAAAARKPRASRPVEDPEPAVELPLRADPAEYLFLADLYETSGRNDTAIQALRLYRQVAPAIEHASIDQRITRLSQR